MKKMKQILAWAGIILLLGLYVITFILGVTGSEATQGLLMASIACTVIIPCLIYGMMLIAKVLKREDPEAPCAPPKDRAPKKPTKR